MSGPAASAPAPGGTALSATEAPFGPACAAVPADPADKGSFAALAQAPVVTAAGQSAQLSEFATALREAGLTRKLNAATGITVFAPTDAAYHKVPANWNAATAGYLVVPETLTPATLAGTHRTLAGSDLTVIGNGHDFLINSTAKVVCGNVRTANAIVYFIDTVLTP